MSQQLDLEEALYTCKFCKSAPATHLLVYEFTPPRRLQRTAIPKQDRRIMALVCMSCGLVSLDEFKLADLSVHDIFWNPHLFKLTERSIRETIQGDDLQP